MKALLILTMILVGCGSENGEVIDQIVVDQTEPQPAQADTPTMMMCQQAEACDSEGVCSQAEKPVEFEIDSTLIHYQACYHFRPCEGKNVFTEEQIETYANQNCGE